MEKYNEGYDYYGAGDETSVTVAGRENGEANVTMTKEEDGSGNTGDGVATHNSQEGGGGSSSSRRHHEESSSKSSSSRREGRDRKSSSHKKDRRSRSRSRSRSRDRDRSSRHEKRRKEKRRHRRRSSSRSRSSKSRSRSRSRSGDRRSRHHRRRRHRSSSRGSSDDYSDYHGDQRWDYKTQYDSYKYQEPNSTIMVRGLAVHLNENDIRQDVLRCGIMVKDIRLIRNRDTGASRGFAFVEFNSVADATRWMDMKKGLLVLHDQFQANLIYSIPKIPTSEGVSKLVADWFCERCHGHNFKRREFCYKCNAPRPDEQDMDLYEEISSHPTSTIILSNLDTLTTEEGVLQAFQSKPNMACIPIKNVKIAREPGTCISRGLCYLEANNVSEASRLFSVLTQDTLEIEGRVVSAAYGKSSNPSAVTKNNSAAAAALAAAQWTNSSSASAAVSTTTAAAPPCTEVKTEADIEKMAQYCAQLYAKTSEEYASYLEYYRNYYRQEVAKGSSTAANDNYSSKSGHSSTSHQQQHHHQQQHQSFHSNNPGVAASGSHASFGWSDKQDMGMPQGAPDTSRYQYDESSGYYFDPVSGLYYDATTQSFYDAEKQQFLHWSANDKKYIAVSGSCDGDNSDKVDILNGDSKQRKGKKGEKPDKVKVAKRIAKEMEKWAKTLNQKKDALRQTAVEPSASITSTNISSTSGYASNSYMPVSASSSGSGGPSKSILDQEYVYTAAENITTYQPASVMVDTLRRTHSEYDSGSDDDKVEFNANSKESSFIDESKLACLLCKRRFSSKEVLQKHIKMSDLHKKNLDALRQGYDDSTPGSSSSAVPYRDRAKERRERFGSEKNVSKNTLKDLYLQAKKDMKTTYVEEPTRDGIKNDNIGNRMLQRMGWHEGQGLGRDNQGRVDIIMAERRSGKLGLGIRTAEPIDDKLDPQTKARKLTLARYQELD